MENNIQKSLFIVNMANVKPVLKPLQLKNNPVTINIKDNLLSSISPRKSLLADPISLFGNKPVLVGLGNSSNLFKKDISIIEPNTSVTNQTAIKKFEGKTWLGKMSSNSNREVAIIIPKGVDYSKPFEIIYHFHGHNGQLGNILTNKNSGLEDKIKSMPKDKNIIIVVPQGPTKALDYTWMNGKNNESLANFQDQTMDIIKNKLSPNIQISSVTVEGHSAGGRVVLNASKDGNLRADKINLLDSSYGNWASESYKNYHKVNPNAKFNIVYIPNSQTQNDALKLKGQNGVQMIKSNVGHGNVPKVFLGL